MALTKVIGEGIGTLTDDLTIPQKIIHSGDTDTHISLADNQIDLTAGDVNIFQGVSNEVVINQGSADVNFRVESNGNANMLVVDGGNDRVGIGEGTPDTPLHITYTKDVAFSIDNFTQEANVGLKIENTSTTASAMSIMQFRTGSGADMFFGIEQKTGNDGEFVFGNQNVSDKEFLRIGVDGDIFAQRVYNNTTSGSVNMVVGSNGQFLRSTSSQKYKNTINDATHGLTELLKLRPVTYKGNNDGDTIFGGLIAEEVHDAGLTEFVAYNDDDQPDALAYGNMVSLCIKAIQELSTKVTALETENKTQATQIADLISRVTALEKA